MASWEPTASVGVSSAQQRWEALTFVHFAYEPDDLSAVLPDGLELDCFDGAAWLGITPFRLHAAVVPVAPGPRSTYVEVNVRTYVRDERGRDGVWFFSLELDQPAVVAALRTAAGLPYRWSDTWIEAAGPTFRYGVRLRPPHRPGRAELGVRVGERLPAPPGALETFLVGRWRAFTQHAGRLVCVPVEHEPWPLRHAELTAWSCDRFFEGLGLPRPSGDPHVLYSPGVEVRLGLPRP